MTPGERDAALYADGYEVFDHTMATLWARDAGGPRVLVVERLGAFVEVADDRLIARVQVARLTGPTDEELDAAVDAEVAELGALVLVEHAARNLAQRLTLAGLRSDVAALLEALRGLDQVRAQPQGSQEPAPVRTGDAHQVGGSDDDLGW